MQLFAFHPDAIAVIDQRGQSLVAAISQHQTLSGGRQFPSRRPFEAKITSKDLIGEMRMGQIDIAGNHVQRTFRFQGGEYGLSGDAYQALRRLAEVILKNKNIRAAVSPTFIEERIFDWCRDVFRSATSAQLSNYLLSEINGSVHKVEVWVPLSEFEIESDFNMGPVWVRTITEEVLDKLDELMVTKAPESAKDIVRQHIEERRRKLLGVGAVVLEAVGETDFVFEQSVETAETVMGLIRFFAPAGVTPWKACTCAVMGSGHIATAEAFMFKSGVFHNYRSSVRDVGLEGLRLRTADVQHFLKNGLSILGGLVNEQELNEFQRGVRSAILMFSKGAKTTDLNDRLMYTFSALEGLLIKGSESIQQNLGERMAFMLEKDADQRQRVVRTVKDAYVLRSGFIHHNMPITEAKALEDVCLIAWKTAFGFIQNSQRYATKSDFIDAIDRMKFGG